MHTPLNTSRPDLVMGIVGAGIMGRGIAQIAATAGIEVRLFDAKPGAAGLAREFVVSMLQRLVDKKKMTVADVAAAAARTRVVARLEDLAGAHVVVEAIVEDLDVKRPLFQQLEAAVGDDCILASNTSSLSVTAIAAACRVPSRVAGFHFFNPVPLMKIVEVVDGARTAPAVGDALLALGARLGHRAVRVRDLPGFLVNHAGRGYGTEALRVLSEGVAGVADIDRIMRDAAGFRMGPLELYDLTGLDVSHPVMESIYHQFYEEPRFRPSPETGRRLAAGLLGRKTHEGFYRYPDGRMESVPEAVAPPDRPASVWVSRTEPEAAGMLLAFLRALPEPPTIETDPAPSAGALCVVTPLGDDATTSATEQGLDARRTVAVDTLLPLKRRITVMATPLTSAAHRRAAHGLLASGGTPVTVVADSPGFVAQRILATIVNIACDIAQQQIAAPADIDQAVRLGLGYPTGPLSWGDALGPRRVLRVLDRLLAITGDPRYRASLWLRRRAMLGMSLAAPDGADSGPSGQLEYQ